MKQDQAEAKAVANALPYGLRMLPVRDVPQLQCLAPELDLFPQPKGPARAEFVGPPEKGIPLRERARFMQNRDFFVKKASQGIYAGADHAEWASIPVSWRVILMMAGGMGDMDTIDYLAGRSWQEIPPAEREAVKFVIREAKRLFAGLHALTLRTVE